MKRLLLWGNKKMVKTVPDDIDKHIKIFIQSNHIVISEAKTLRSIAKKKNYSRSISCDNQFRQGKSISETQMS